MLNSDNSHFPFKLWQCCTIQFGPVTVAVMQLLLLFVARETTLLTSGTAGSPSGKRDHLSSKGLGFKPPVLASIHPAEVALSKTLKAFQLRVQCSLSDLDL